MQRPWGRDKLGVSGSREASGDCDVEFGRQEPHLGAFEAEVRSSGLILSASSTPW